MIAPRTLIAAAAGLALAALIGAWAGARLVGARESEASRTQVASQRALAQLAERLEDERIARERLETEVALLRSVIESPRVEKTPSSAQGDSADAQAALADAGADAASDQDVAAITERARQAHTASNFDSGRLTALGVGESEADRLRTRWEQNELDKLYLADRASREGWLFKPRYAEESAALESGMRRDVADEYYDQMLFAAGKANRVVVSSVLGGSAASEVGIEPGDQILAYGDQRIFTPGELRSATRDGKGGENVRIEVERDGRRQFFWVARGPLGTLIQHEKREPVQ